MQKTASIIILLLTITSCKNSDANKNDKIRSAEWLLGSWECRLTEGRLSETWTKTNDSTFQGNSFYIKGKDTLHFEKISLQQNGQDLFYKAVVRGQDNDRAVSYKLRTEPQKQLVFENPKHDYPKKISYTQTTNDDMEIQISGTQLGKPSSEKHKMKRTAR